MLFFKKSVCSRTRWIC